MIKKCLAAATLVGLLGGTVALAAEIKVFGNPGVRSALRDLAPQFERKTGHKVVLEFDVLAVMKRRIDAGETFDVVILSPSMIDDLVKQGKVAPDTRTSFGRTGLALVVPKGAPKPDISSVENLKRALLNAKAVGYSKEGASGIHFLEIVTQLGIAQEMQSKLKPYVRLPEPVEKREVDMAITGTGPALEMTVADFLGSLPPAVQRYVTYAAGVSAIAQDPEASRALLRFLRSPTAAPALKARGLDFSGE